MIEHGDPEADAIAAEIDAAERDTEAWIEEQERRRRFRFETIAELINRPPPRWLVQEVLPETGIGVVWGAPGSGKTFAVFDLCAAIATGGTAAGRRTRQASVGYVATEGALRNRAAAYLVHHGMSEGDLARLRVLSLGVNLLGENSDVPMLIEALREVERETGGIGLVVVDTLNRAMPGGNENGPEDMGRMVRAAATIAEAFGCFVLYVHHSGKDESRGSRGHSSLKGAVDAEISIERSGDVRTMTLIKAKDAEDGPVLASFRLKPIDLGAAAEHDPHAEPHERVTSCVVEPCDPQPRAERLLPAEREMLDAFHLLMDRGVGKLPPLSCGEAGHPPGPGQTAISDTELRGHLYRAWGDDGGTAAETVRKRYKRARDGLQAAGKLEFFDGWAWLPIRSGQAGQGGTLSRSSRPGNLDGERDRRDTTLRGVPVVPPRPTATPAGLSKTWVMTHADGSVEDLRSEAPVSAAHVLNLHPEVRRVETTTRGVTHRRSRTRIRSEDELRALGEAVLARLSP